MKPGAGSLRAVQTALEDDAGRSYLEDVLDTYLGCLPGDTAVAVYVYAEADGRLRPVAARGSGSEQLTALSFLPGQGLVGRAYDKGQRLIEEEGDLGGPECDGLSPGEWGLSADPGQTSRPLRAVGAGPVRLEDECVGAVLVVFWDELAVPAGTGRLVSLLGTQVALAVQNVLLRRELSQERQQLEYAREQLFQSDKMASIGQLAAGVAHEINNPIGFIHSNLNTLSEYVTDLISIMSKEEETEQQLKQHLNGQATELFRELDLLKDELTLHDMLDDLQSLVTECQEGTERVNRIVRDLKSFSRPDSEDPEVARVDDILDSALNIVWNQLKYKATVTKKYSDLPAITCYPNQLGQVFVNLLVNAGQAIKEKGEIALHTYQHNGRVCVDVHDKGCGISPEHLHRIFEPFFTTKPIGQGTGLGLSISHGIVQKHGGDIRVESEVGVGTTFTVCLPFTCAAP